MFEILGDDDNVELVNPRRLVTYFIYLNTLPEGQGCTEFPRLNIAVTPKRRRYIRR